MAIVTTEQWGNFYTRLTIILNECKKIYLNKGGIEFRVQLTARKTFVLDRYNYRTSCWNHAAELDRIDLVLESIANVSCGNSWNDNIRTSF